VPETREFSLELAFARKNVGPRLFDPYGLVRILFPLKAQPDIRMGPFGDTSLKGARNIIENILVAVEKFLIFLLHLRA